MRWWWLGLVLVLVGCQRPCNASTCDGCCASATECVAGQTNFECGRGGEACDTCRTGERCVSQRCEVLAVPDAGPVDAGPPRCECPTSCCYPDGSCAPNNEPSACGPAKSFCGSCAAGERCELGVCKSGSCAGGCLDPLGTCQAGSTDDACGTDGGVCVACGVNQQCQLGRCRFIRCDVDTCRFGCCKPDLSCVSPSASACGLGGGACVDCGDAGTCLAGSCQ